MSGLTGKTLTVDERALTVIGAQYQRLRDLAMAFGFASPQYMEAAKSHAKVTESIFMAGFGPEARVYAEDELSLLVIEGGFTYGVIWFAHKRRCTTPGCQAYFREDGQTYVYGDRDTARQCDAHEPDIALNLPTPGTWSQHS